MYFEQQQEYLSEPFDDKNQSSYIKINKQFLEELKMVSHLNDVDDFSKYDPSSQEDRDTKLNNFAGGMNEKGQNKSRIGNKILYDPSPIKSNFYQEIIDRNNQHGPKNDSIVKSSASKDKSRNLTPQEKRQFLKLTEKISKFTQFDKKQACTPSEKNTLEYYLLKKSHDRKYKDTQILENQFHEENQMNDIQTRPQLYSPKNQLHSSSNRNHTQNAQKIQFERINYKKLLENEITKNKDLERQVYKLQTKLVELNLQYEETTKYSRKLEKQLTGASLLRKENKNRMKELDSKLEGFKNVCKLKNYEKDSLVMETRKQNKLLKEQNEKYRVFTETLAESIFVLKGKKPKNLEDIWKEWKEVFEIFSKSKWNIIKSKSPNKKA